jgi:hypothetical protein
MAVVTALVVACVALAIAPGHAFYFDVTPKVAVLLAGAGALVTAAARRKELRRAPRLFTVVLALNGASLGLSTALSANGSLSLYGGSWRGYGALVEGATMLFAWLVARQSNARPMLWVVAIAAVPAAIWGTLGDSRSLAVWLAMSVFLAMALATIETRAAWRTVARMAAVAALAALVVVCARQPPWAGTRRLLWRDTVSMALRRPFAGYGPEVFLGEFPRFESKALAQVSPDTIYESPRNAFLDVLAAQGVPGMLLFCALCTAGLHAAWKRKDAWLAAALAAGIVGLQFTALTVPTAVLLFSTIALAVCAPEKSEAPRRAPMLAAVAPFLVLALLYLALRVTMADHELVLTRRLLDARDLRAATEYDAYWFWRLPGASADVWYSRSWLEVARGATDADVEASALGIAEEAAARAAQNAEEPFLAWFNLAQIAIFERKFGEAEQHLRWAISTHPNWYLPHRVLAQELLRQSRIDEAQKEIAIAGELERR